MNFLVGMGYIRLLFFSLSFGIVSSITLASGEADMEYLKNGLPVIHKRTGGNSIVGIVCLVRTGSSFERPGENGITSLVQSLLLKGTRKYSASELALALEREGIVMNVDASEDYAAVSCMATVDQLDTALDLMSEVLFHPSFEESEIEKEKQNAIAHIHLSEDNKFYLTFKHLRGLLFQGHPYALHPDGTPETIDRIDRSMIVDFHKTYYQPQNMILSVVGDVSRADLMKCARRHFGKKKASPVQLFSFDKKIVHRSKTEIVRKPIEQGFIAIAFPGVPMNEEDFPALRLASVLLGEGMSSRFFIHLRDRQGLAYSVGCLYLNLRNQGAVVGYIGTRPDSLKNARLRMRELFETLSEEKISDEEMDRAKNYLIGKYLVAHQKNIRKAFYLAWFQFLGLGLEFDEKYPELIRSVTSKDVRRVARKYFRSPCIVTLQPGEPTLPEK